MKDLILSCIANYQIDQVRNWVISLNECGFEGDKIAIIYNLPITTKQYLKNYGFQLFEYKLTQNHFFVQRFFDKWHLLNRLKISDYRYIISTDVRDLIFQNNPSIWLENNLKDKKILVSSESIRIQDERWNNSIMKKCFTHLYEDFKNFIVHNAGSLAGEINTMRDFFLNLFQFSLSADDKESDQPSLNILINLEHIKPLVKYAKMEEGWCAQLVTTHNPRLIDLYKDKINEPRPIIKEDGIVTNNANIPFVLVHQYDRVPNLMQKINKKYSSLKI